MRKLLEATLLEMRTDFIASLRKTISAHSAANTSRVSDLLCLAVVRIECTE